MPNTINLRLLDNKNIIAELNGIPLAQENSYKIIAGEENATQFKIASKPSQYENATYTVEMVNSQGYGIDETDIIDDTFSLPIGMAVAGYGWVQIRAYQGEEKVPFMILKIKVWNTLPNWKDHISEGGGDVNITIDKEINAESTNPVENKVIKEALDNKLDKIKTGGLGAYCYRAGVQVGVNCNWSAGVLTLAYRNNNGTFDVGDAVNDKNPVTLGQFNEVLEGKANKIIPDAYKSAYIITTTGEEQLIPVVPGYPNASSIPQRGPYGEVLVNTPTITSTGKHAINKDYLNEKLEEVSGGEWVDLKIPSGDNVVSEYSISFVVPSNSDSIELRGQIALQEKSEAERSAPVMIPLYCRIGTTYRYLLLNDRSAYFELSRESDNEELGRTLTITYNNDTYGIQLAFTKIQYKIN